MITLRRLGTALLALAFTALGGAAQQPTMQDMLARMDSMQATVQAMHHMMMSMHGGGDTHADHGATQGNQGMPEMPGMQGAGSTATCSMDALQPLFGTCTLRLALTATQTEALNEILARARVEALAALTPEQRERLGAHP
jgi:hypothetical protein